MSHRYAFRPRSVTKLHLPPCCSLCTSSIHSSAMPILASCVLLPSDFMTPSSLHHLFSSPMLKHFFSSSVLPTFLSSFLQIHSSSTPLSCHPSISPTFSNIPSPHPTPYFPCQSAVTGFVGVWLAVSMSSQSQQ